MISILVIPMQYFVKIKTGCYDMVKNVNNSCLEIKLMVLNYVKLSFMSDLYNMEVYREQRLPHTNSRRHTLQLNNKHQSEI